MFRTGFNTRSNHAERQAKMPIARPSITEKGVATTMTDSVSIAHFHCPISAIQTNVPPDSAASRQPFSAKPTMKAVTATTIQGMGPRFGQRLLP